MRGYRKDLSLETLFGSSSFLEVRQNLICFTDILVRQLLELWCGQDTDIVAENTDRTDVPLPALLNAFHIYRA